MAGEPTELLPPLKARGKPLFKYLTVDVVDQLCDAMAFCYFEKKAMSYIGYHPDTLMKWKRIAREYRAELEDEEREPNRRDRRYPALYLLYRIDRSRFELRGRLFRTSYAGALGQSAEFLMEDGKLVLGKDGNPVKVRSEVKPDPHEARMLLGILDRDFAPRSKSELQLVGEEDDEGRPTELTINVVRSRPDPRDSQNGEDETNGEDASNGETNGED